MMAPKVSHSIVSVSNTMLLTLYLSFFLVKLAFSANVKLTVNYMPRFIYHLTAYLEFYTTQSSATLENVLNSRFKVLNIIADVELR